MSLLQSFILGAVQGLTEFLPVSSSAHLVLVQHLLGFRKELIFYDVVLHFGTLAALFVYFAADIAHLIRDSIYGISFIYHRKPLNHIAEAAPHSRWALGILVATIPTALTGIIFKDEFESMFGSLANAGWTLLITTVLLWLTRYFQKDEKGIGRATYLDFILIGLIQGVSIIPGISRSGATIATALFLGFKREEAFRFSFLLAIPAILGAGVVELKDGIVGWQWGWPILVIGFAAAGILGYLSLYWLARVTRSGKIHWFAVYTLFIGILILALSSRFE